MQALTDSCLTEHMRRMS